MKPKHAIPENVIALSSRRDGLERVTLARRDLEKFIRESGYTMPLKWWKCPDGCGQRLAFGLDDEGWLHIFSNVWTFDYGAGSKYRGDKSLSDWSAKTLRGIVQALYFHVRDGRFFSSNLVDAIAACAAALPRDQWGRWP